MIVLSFIFLGGAVSTSAFYINSSLNIADTQTKREGDSQSDILENDEVRANAPTNSGYWTDSGNYATSFAGGSGTSSNPYLISTPKQLARLAYVINNSSTYSSYKSLYYKQTADLDMSAFYWKAIGGGSSDFAGSYDGDGHIISGIYTEAEDSGQGLFGGVDGFLDKRSVEIFDVGIIDSNIQGNNFVGAIAGSVGYYVTINNCYNAGYVSGNNHIGGIVGSSGKFSLIKNCYNVGNVSGNDNIGGILGRSFYSTTIFNCYNAGTISGPNYVGGIAGYVDTRVGYTHYDITIANCYNIGAINSSGSRVGGIAGYAIYITTITYCYWGGNCTLRIAVGYIDDDVIVSNTGTCTVNNVKDLSWYQNSSKWDADYPWDFENTWAIYPSQNNGYPVLKSLVKIYIISFNSNGGQGNMDSVEVEPNSSVTLPECDFTRTGHKFAGWALSSTGTVAYSDGQTITPTSSMTLYAVWREAVYEISIYWNLRSGGSSTRPPSTPDTSIYYRYGGTFYSDQTCLSPLSATDLVNSKIRDGYSFVSFTNEFNGGDVMLQNNQYLNTNLILSDDDWYAHWKANVEAKYDSEGDYWYVENGKMPQTRVTDSSLISSLNSATTNGANYYIAGQTLTARVYNGNEYCQWNNNWYEVEPIRWRLGDYTRTGGGVFGTGTTTDTYAVLDKIVFVGQYSTSSVGEGKGYSPISTTEFMKNGIDTTYLVDYTASTQTFGDGTTLYGAEVDVSSKIFVSSQEEIEQNTGTIANHVGTTAVEFSDLASDIIKFYGGTNVYFTRDLGSNYNNIVCFNKSGSEVQRNATLYRGVQFTICFTEHAYIG